MYQFLAIPDFARAGLNSDLQPWDLPPSALTDIKNVRINNNQLSAFGYYANFTDLPAGFNPGMVMPVNATSAYFWLIAGLNSVQVYDGQNVTDISSLEGYAGINNEEDWVGCMLSRIPIINNPGHYPEYWSPQDPAIKLRPLPWDALNSWDDANQSCRILRSHKQFLIAMDLVDNGVEYPDGVQWSAPADIGGVPPTWDFLDDTNVAGRTTLGGDSGAVIDGLSLRDAFCIYRESGITVFDFVPQSSFIWQIRNLSSSYGLLAKNSVVEVEGRHLFITDGDVLINDGNSIRSIMHNRIQKRFNSDFNADSYQNCYAVANYNSNEVWFCVPDAGAKYPTIAYIYNWRDDSWALRDIPEGVHASYGISSSPILIWDNVQGTWDTSSISWTRDQSSPLDENIIQAVPVINDFTEPALLTLDLTSNPSENSFTSRIERIGMPLAGLHHVTTIVNIYPHIIGPTPVKIELGSQDYPGAPVRWKAPVIFDPNTDRKVDIRTTGELHAFRITSENLNDPKWNLSGIDIEYVMAGKR